jgi:hypothetical protein
MTVRRNDPDKLRFNFWYKNKWAAPFGFRWEEGEVHYDYVVGFHPSKPGPRVLTALTKLWGVSKKGSTMTYAAYMQDKMSAEHLDICFHKMTNLTWVEQVYGDCTLENIILTPDRVILIDPGHGRGLNCTENDQGKLLQSIRGWEQVKAGSDGNDVSLISQPDNIVAIYVTHLYRLLRHKHSEWCLKWAKMEIDHAIEHLSN